MTYQKSMHKAATDYCNLCINPTESAGIGACAMNAAGVEAGAVSAVTVSFICVSCGKPGSSLKGSNSSVCFAKCRC